MSSFVGRTFRTRSFLRQLWLTLATGLSALLVLTPIVWMVLAAVRPIKEVLTYPPRLIPSEITFEYFRRIMVDPQYQRYAINSTLLSVTTVVVALTLGFLAAYGFSRFRLRGGRAMLLGILALLMLPKVALIVPFFRLAHVFNVYDTVLGLILVNTAFVLPMSVWLLKGYIDSIPVALEEAAMIDGCNRLQALIKVVLPVVVPGLIGVGTYVFIGSWNEYLLAVIMTDTSNSQTLPVGLAQFFGQYVRDWNSIMALSSLTSFPLVVIFVFFQRWVVQGMTSGAVK